MPAVLSKMLARLLLEEMAVLDRQLCKKPVAVSVPISMVQPVVPWKCMPWPPRLSWSCYAAKERVQEPELAAQLLRLVDPVPDERVEALATTGFDAITVTHWILVEEVHAFNRHLNDATAQLRRITRNNYVANKHLPTAQRIVQQFQDTVNAERQKGRSLACWNCRIDVDKGKVCGGCRIAWYCSRECQKQDWWETHKDRCLSLEKRARA